MNWTYPKGFAEIQLNDPWPTVVGVDHGPLREYKLNLRHPTVKYVLWLLIWQKIGWYILGEHGFRSGNIIYIYNVV